MKKIMFNDRYGLTKAVLEGRKTMTRRKVKHLEEVELNGYKYLLTEELRYQVGEVVAVAQKYSEIEIPISGETRIYNEGLDLYQSKLEYEPGWTNKMFVSADLMPHHIRITNVRVKRLQDISDEDCRKEGIDYVGGYSESYYFGHGVENIRLGNSYREAFAALIDKVSGKGTWEANPWVFVYEFELVK